MTVRGDVATWVCGSSPMAAASMVGSVPPGGVPGTLCTAALAGVAGAGPAVAAGAPIGASTSTSTSPGRRIGAGGT